MKHLKRKLLSILSCFCLLTAAGCQNPANLEPVQKTGIFFDTVVTIRLYDSTDTELIEKCFRLCKEYENKFSRTIETSEISQINRSGGTPVTVSPETAGLIRTGLRYCELSGGAFDITIAPLSELWDFKNNEGSIPPDAAIKEALRHVGYQNVIVEGNTVTLKDSAAGLDLGAIAKGYIADRLKEFLLENEVRHATINLGGNVLTVGGKTEELPFSIGVQKPFAGQNETLLSLSVRDQSVVSSGIYERYFEKEGKIYHHILNPKTGYPYENSLWQVTILSADSVDGDALSTTCFALGLEEGLKLVDSLEDTEAVFVTSDGRLHYSKNIEDIIVK